MYKKAIFQMEVMEDNTIKTVRHHLALPPQSPLWTGTLPAFHNSFGSFFYPGIVGGHSPASHNLQLLQKSSGAIKRKNNCNFYISCCNSAISAPSFWVSSPMTQRILASTTGASSWSIGKYFAECCALLSKTNNECCVLYKSLTMILWLWQWTKVWPKIPPRLVCAR